MFSRTAHFSRFFKGHAADWPEMLARFFGLAACIAPYILFTVFDEMQNNPGINSNKSNADTKDAPRLGANRSD